jgi:hypothetical protein
MFFSLGGRKKIRDYVVISPAKIFIRKSGKLAKTGGGGGHWQYFTRQNISLKSTS